MRHFCKNSSIFLATPTQRSPNKKNRHSPAKHHRGSPAKHHKESPARQQPRKQSSPVAKAESSTPPKPEKKSQMENLYEVKVTHFVSPSEFHLQAADAGRTGLDQ